MFSRVLLMTLSTRSRFFRFMRLRSILVRARYVSRALSGSKLLMPQREFANPFFHSNQVDCPAILNLVCDLAPKMLKTLPQGEKRLVWTEGRLDEARTWPLSVGCLPY
jgi:hypothetical protein